MWPNAILDATPGRVLGGISSYPILLPWVDLSLVAQPRLQHRGPDGPEGWPVRMGYHSGQVSRTLMSPGGPLSPLNIKVEVLLS